MNATEFKSFRKRLNLTQPQMAVMVGVPLRSWVNWETGSRVPPASAKSLVSLLKLIETMAPGVFNVRLDNARRSGR